MRSRGQRGSGCGTGGRRDGGRVGRAFGRGGPGTAFGEQVRGEGRGDGGCKGEVRGARGGRARDVEVRDRDGGHDGAKEGGKWVGPWRRRPVAGNGASLTGWKARRSDVDSTEK